MNNLPKNFEQYSETRRNGFIKVKELKDKGQKVVGTFCTFAPVEAIYAAGAYPISLCAVSEETIPDAEKHLPKNLCPLIKASYGFALTDKCPYTYFSDLIVGETTCDGKKKMYEYLEEIKPLHVMQLPQNTNRDHALKVWKEEIKYFIERLEEQFNVKVTEEALKEAIKIRNEERTALKDLYSLAKLNPAPISGLQLHKIIDATHYTFDKKEQNRMIRETIEDIKNNYEANRDTYKTGPRILITGCPIGGVADKVLTAIEEAGGVVVCFENCSGIKEKIKLVDETKDPIDALAEKYLSIPCSVMAPNDGRLELISDLVDEFQVDGVIDITLQACHTYNVETHRIKKFVNEEKKIPYMNIETDYSTSDIGQLKTRMAAFIEML
ncbi:MAG: 2-hydroxyacyl-CoA dehydratase [Clostridium argentinense]|uniref:2-hydroxyacyl-CoA dehydratase n=1 Tax=Clostridium faecium TaxID=2762223 RepID=A0ABR8YX85_9CLOT|nr:MULTISPECIES: double-cubane-cluster-containing anaerobic reductase [Clostridium]MBD8048840.1 2-hydroxyacyl-CoA dehydratase [Clostridium faecium]MBS5824829.1 2-hydroxyacyl-CoA dehydratase [Clostridium argentinense]MDU1349216.1 double-cubane-cluster-containing anaerobic reductase [Clostridium argentinense]